MAGKVRLLEFDAHDDNNILLDGLTIVAYPENTLLHGTLLTQPGGTGRYLATFDYIGAGDDLIICRAYDLRDETGAPVMLMESVPIGKDWEWIIDVVIAATPHIVVFNPGIALVDALDGLDLPTQIPNCVVEPLYGNIDRKIHITNVLDTGFTINCSVAGAPLPMTYRFKLSVGEV